MNRLVYQEFCDLEDLNPEVIKQYSLFKHGCIKATKNFSLKLAEVISRHIVEHHIDKNIAFVGAPYNKVPVASTFLASKTASIVSNMTGKNIEVLKVNRMHSYHDDYGSMSSELRKKSLSGESFNIDPSLLDNKHVYFIDDIFITGAHEERMLNMINSLEGGFTFNFCYFLKLESKNCNPAIEKELNNSFIDEKSYLKLSNRGKLFLNTRVTKLIFRSDSKTFKRFINTKNITLLKHLKSSCEANDYQDHPLYVSNFKVLKQQLQC